jgi:PHD/YefM family antitoxin component YafN of YafNO toxin-antitoxin module
MFMRALKTEDLRKDFKRVSQIAISGEPILISRPHNENLVLISEKEFRRLQNLTEHWANMVELSAAQQSSLAKIWDTVREDEVWASL